MHLFDVFPAGAGAERGPRLWWAVFSARDPPKGDAASRKHLASLHSTGASPWLLRLQRFNDGRHFGARRHPLAPHMKDDKRIGPRGAAQRGFLEIQAECSCNAIHVICHHGSQHDALFGMQNRTLGPYVAAIDRILISVIRRAGPALAG
jgi:hypothetical protein